MKKIPAFIILILVLASCTQGIIPEYTAVVIPETQVITYTANIQTIVSNRCVSCHSTSNAQGGLVLETYTQVKNSTQNGNLIQRINDPANPMPTTGLMPAQQRALFDAWVQNGYLEN